MAIPSPKHNSSTDNNNTRRRTRTAARATLSLITAAILFLGSNLTAFNFGNVLIGISLANAVVCTAPPSGMVSWWPGDGNAKDIKDGNDGTLINGATFGTGEVSQGFSLTRSTNAAIQGSSTTGFPVGSSPRAIAAWIKTTGVDSTYGYGILHYGVENGNLPPTNFHLYVSPTGKAAVGNGWGYGSAEGTTLVNDNNFHFIVGVYEGPSTNIARIYVDGVQEGSSAITTPGTLNGIFRIGSYMPNNGFEHGHFPGIIDEVAIFNRALSQSEIQSIFSSGSAGMCKVPPPTANAGPDQTVNEGDSVTLDGTASKPGTGGSIDQYNWEQTGGPSVTLSGANTAKATFTAPSVTANTNLTFKLTVTDYEGGTSSDTVVVTVTNVNQPPVAKITANPTTINEGSTSALDATTSSDSDGTIATYEFSQTAGTAGTITVDSTNPAKATFKAPSVSLDETATIQVKVTDNDGATSTATVDIAVKNVNQAPTANAGADFAVDEGTTGVELKGSGTDSDGTIASYQWVQTAGPNVQLSNANTATAAFDAPSVSADTKLTFKLTVTDNDGATATDDVVVTVKDVSAPPPPSNPKYTINGFYAPVDMKDTNGNPIVNTIKSGKSVALKFEVFDQNNVEQTSTDVIQSSTQRKVDCSTLQGDSMDPIEITNTGGTTLRYDTTSGTFIQNWKTPSGPAGSCYSATVTTVDGSSITAYFQLK